MAKFALILLALVAVQGCIGSSIGQLKITEFDQVVSEFASLTRDIQSVIGYLSGHMASIAREFEHEIGEIFKKYALYPIIVELRETIVKLESEAAENTKECFKTAWMMTGRTTQELKGGLDNCISDARSIAGQILNILASIDRRATKARSDTTDGFKKCKKEHGATEEAVKCLRKTIEPLKIEVAGLKLEVQNADKKIHKEIEDAKRNLNICLQHLQRDITQLSENTIDILTQCTDKNSAKPKSGSIPDFINELIEKINKIIHIVTDLPSSIAEIPDKINEIISRINISVIYSQLKSEVHDIISNGGPSAEQCRPEADQKLNDIVKSAEDESKVCITATEGMVEKVETEFNLLVTAGNELLHDFNTQILDCFTENGWNPVDTVKCLKDQGKIYEGKISVLENQVIETVKKTKVEADELLKTLASCVNKVQLDTINHGQDLIENVEKCVLNA